VARRCRWCLAVTGPFGCRCLTSKTLPRFHVPLIEPDVQVYRIRLSDKDSCIRPRGAGQAPAQVDEPVRFVQLSVRKA
jgi:hypothetical protein